MRPKAPTISTTSLLITNSQQKYKQNIKKYHTKKQKSEADV